MDTVHALISHLTDTRTTLDTIREMLRQTDRGHAAEEHCFAEGIRAIRDAQGADLADKLLQALEDQLAAKLLFLFWNGIHLNAACFRDPAKKDFLHLDFELIHQEHLLDSLPSVRPDATELLHQLPQELTDPIISYISYLETYGYKLAHYLGFRVGDDLLPWILPGYVCDQTLTLRYETMLTQYLQEG